jgi:cytochrome c5
MTRRMYEIFAIALLAVAAAALGQPNPAHKPATRRTLTQIVKQTPQGESAQVHSDAGERVFQANCGRCHSAPEQFSPSISGTILRHMRVRANLSAEDERAILRYIAP